MNVARTRLHGGFSVFTDGDEARFAIGGGLRRSFRVDFL